MEKKMKFRKKPVVIEAVKFEYTEECIQKLKEFLGDSAGRVIKNRHPDAVAELEIVTLEDGKFLSAKHIATEGDWIIKGVKGEFYACKPDIFEQTYDSADTAGEMSLEDQVEFLRKYCKQQADTISSMSEQRAQDAKNLNKAMLKLFELAKKHNEPLFKEDADLES